MAENEILNPAAESRIIVEVINILRDLELLD